MEANLEDLGLGIGYRLKPFDRELVKDYLMKKVRGEPISPNPIPDCDLYGKRSPWEIFDQRDENTWYCFTTLKKASKNRIRRVAGNGTWHGSTSAKGIFDIDNNKLIGFKKTFTFKVNGKKTDWTMNEFTLAGEDTSDYVICKIKNKKAAVSHNSEENKEAVCAVYDETNWQREVISIEANPANNFVGVGAAAVAEEGSLKFLPPSTLNVSDLGQPQTKESVPPVDEHLISETQAKIILKIEEDLLCQQQQPGMDEYLTSETLATTDDLMLMIEKCLMSDDLPTLSETQENTRNNFVGEGAEKSSLQKLAPSNHGFSSLLGEHSLENLMENLPTLPESHEFQVCNSSYYSAQECLMSGDLQAITETQENTRNNLVGEVAVEGSLQLLAPSSQGFSNFLGEHSMEKQMQNLPTQLESHEFQVSNAAYYSAPPTDIDLWIQSFQDSCLS